ncbi:Methyltransferase-like protein [Lachnellula occidentalis]|uniref:Methyltransferase-like protein n=1 Tax=Lachnellula occidentalis TaxID=215460 RepID=A0A8H8RC96_9HELO|nr:Methyltransferase-like protein [Lachnellula occidentalis]
MLEQTRDVFAHLIQPILFMYLAASYIPSTISLLLSPLQLNILLSPSAFKEIWFARFWSVYGPELQKNTSPAVGPLLQHVHGIVLDIGPGSGEWLPLFPANRISKIYGVEPNKDHHAALRRKIRECGLEGVYEIVPVGIEDLEEGGWIKEGRVDSVVTLFCLCSIPRPREMVARLYGLLGDGGVWVLYEHVRVKEGRWVGWYQSVMNLFWPYFLGGCELRRDTGRWVKEVGPWSQVELVQPANEPEYQVVPHIKGVLVK